MQEKWNANALTFFPVYWTTYRAQRIHLSRMIASASRDAASGEARPSVAICSAVPKALKKHPIWGMFGIICP